MSEVLSQSEIDNLLAAFSTGELDVEQMQEKVLFTNEQFVSVVLTYGFKTRP